MERDYRDYDEVISEMLIQLAKIEQSRKKENARMEAFDKRMELTIKRMVKVESRLEGSEKRMALFDQKLERSIVELEQYSKDQREFSTAQSQINKYFIDYINRSNSKIMSYGKGQNCQTFR